MWLSESVHYYILINHTERPNQTQQINDNVGIFGQISCCWLCHDESAEINKKYYCSFCHTKTLQCELGHRWSTFIGTHY